MDKTTLIPVIKVESLCKSYKKIKAVNQVSFSVNKGEVFGLIGPDGAGKTSIIQILAGVLKADEGKAFINDIDVTKNPEKAKAIIGYMPQGLGLNLYDSLSIEENIEFFRGLRLIPDEIFEKNKKTLLEITRLTPFLKRQARALSGGMRQKLALVCTLLHLPDIILLDEPTTGVDPLSRQDFWNIIHGLVRERGVTVLLTTSYMDEAERCHRVALMHEGRILLQGSPDELGNLEEVFIEKVSSSQKVSSSHLKEVPFSHSESFFCRSERSEESHIISCKSVTKIFGKFKAVDSVTFDVKRGEILGLLGPNGAGKTTLIKMMCGLLEPSGGSISINGFDVRKEKKKIWSTIGYMSQRFSLYRDLTVMENMKLYAGLYSVKKGDFRGIIELLGLKGLENRTTKDLPLGIRQRVALACALLHEPPVLFLDEPTSGVDPIARRSFWKIIFELSRKRGVTVIVSTHYMDEAENCDRLCLMHHGRLIAMGSPEEIKKGSEKISGTLIQLKSKQFHQVYDLIIKEIQNISIYGSKIFIRSFEPETTIRKIEELLKNAQIREYEIIEVTVPLQEAFVDYIRESEDN
ncbi:ABC-2 type transport system ATP-binding protein [Thermodesulfovibrio aggregans]|uniref:ABC-2 type transport system ATP-binding protein n=1 Tax=Thermodesulfovibrio aggregans TaxID=86166 RepID=A0A0U9HRR8_9BACT|nr:ATP-binding cassette domain-containing protein [Thermodesulfovibrio aggregans]GAQ95707.1 ABC-2 type transport system ATP-binding protein [Thermodesulfovibrio aggregans]